MSAPDATNVTGAAEPTREEQLAALRGQLPFLCIGICPLCHFPIRKRDHAEYRGSDVHKACAALQIACDNEEETTRLREDFDRLRASLFGPIPRKAH